MPKSIGLTPGVAMMVLIHKKNYYMQTRGWPIISKQHWSNRVQSLWRLSLHTLAILWSSLYFTCSLFGLFIYSLFGGTGHKIEVEQSQKYNRVRVNGTVGNISWALRLKVARHYTYIVKSIDQYRRIATSYMSQDNSISVYRNRLGNESFLIKEKQRKLVEIIATLIKKVNVWYILLIIIICYNVSETFYIRKIIEAPRLSTQNRQGSIQHKVGSTWCKEHQRGCVTFSKCSHAIIHNRKTFRIQYTIWSVSIPKHF